MAKTRNSETLLSEFRRHLEESIKSASAAAYVGIVRRFLKHIGDTSLDQVPEETVRKFFTGIKNRHTRTLTAMVIRDFIRFAVPKLPAVVGRADKPTARPVDAKEIELRQRWSVDKLVSEKVKADDTIALLARKLIDHYLYFQGRLRGEPENFDEITRFADECRDLIERNLPLFMSLSAGGRNVHSKIDERVQS